MQASESLRIFVVRWPIARSAQRSSKSYSIEERPSAEALSSGDHHYAEDMEIFPRPRARYSSTFVPEGEAVESFADQMAP
jgi:hypothetical protein